MNVKPTQFNKDNPGSDIQLTIKGATEEETLQWSRDKGEIYISSLKAFAEVDPFSLKSIELELNKVIESAKK